MWSVSHEAISLGDPELVKNVIMYRDYQRSVRGAQSMKNCLKTLEATKQTLHDDEALEEFTPSEEAVHMRMSSPISTTFIDVDKIGFERSYRGGLLGRPKKVTKKSNNFKATLWLAEDYPLSFQEQVMPIVDLMAANSAHFARLHNFIRMQLPAGFPVRIEIPLFHVVSAKITFGQINEPGPFVTPLETMEDDPLAIALRISRDEEQRRQEEARREEEELERILQLSLVD
ncbi:hypothetical protein TELCIR_06009 [Teladorsagia circumcincta]|uniref:Ankyrin repeat domain-containing protein n=1 Tax=Teladorsagia circumcincta TaxID=45464 RepID=A0A2G9UPD7_TELCI|nr:hypothetical protein TELCIR_06009 [Teladorsagia circumcincta]